MGLAEGKGPFCSNLDIPVILFNYPRLRLGRVLFTQFDCGFA
jgi:hypothetical protein